jgi:hypothetical protein
MNDYPKRINNKEKQASAGNWGHPRPFLKKMTKVIPYPSTWRKANRKRKEKKKWRGLFEVCPFCDNDLVKLEKTEEEKNSLRFISIFDKYEKKCRACGAHEVPDCPCCHRPTWYKDGIYKHNGYISFCGFTGKRLKRDNNKAVL